MTWKPPERMTERQIQKELNRQAVMFEELAEEWFSEYAALNLRASTFEEMRKLTKRVYPALGHLRIDKITARQIQTFLNSLAKDGANMLTGKPLPPPFLLAFGQPRRGYRHGFGSAWSFKRDHHKQHLLSYSGKFKSQSLRRNNRGFELFRRQRGVIFKIKNKRRTKTKNPPKRNSRMALQSHS